jgi:hypothetical protein
LLSFAENKRNRDVSSLPRDIDGFVACAILKLPLPPPRIIRSIRVGDESLARFDMQRFRLKRQSGGAIDDAAKSSNSFYRDRASAMPKSIAGKRDKIQIIAARFRGIPRVYNRRFLSRNLRGRKQER